MNNIHFLLSYNFCLHNCTSIIASPMYTYFASKETNKHYVVKSYRPLDSCLESVSRPFTPKVCQRLACGMCSIIIYPFHKTIGMIVLPLHLKLFTVWKSGQKKQFRNINISKAKFRSHILMIYPHKLAVGYKHTLRYLL